MESGNALTTNTHKSRAVDEHQLTVSTAALTALTVITSVLACLEIPNLELSLFDLPILLCLIWHRWTFAVGNWALGAVVGFALWGSQDLTAWSVIYLNTLLFIGFIILLKRSFRQLGLSVVGIGYWLLLGAPLTFILFASHYSDTDLALIATGQRLFSGLLVITLAIAAHFIAVLVQHRLPVFVFGGGRRFTVRMREIAETAAIMAASIPMLILLWALIDSDTEGEIAALFAASDARFESLALSADANLAQQRTLLQSLRSLAAGVDFEQRASSDFDQQLLDTINASDALGFALQAAPDSPVYVSASLATFGVSPADLASALSAGDTSTAVALTDDKEGLTGYLVSLSNPSVMLVYPTPLALWDALYGSDMLGLMSGLKDAGMIDRVSHFHGPSAQELYGISDDAVIVRQEYDYAIWVPPARYVDPNKPFKRLEKLSKSYITFQASDELIASFDRDLYDVDCFRYTVDLWSHIKDSLLNTSFLIFGAALVLFVMAALIEFAVGRFSAPFRQLAKAMEHFSNARPGDTSETFTFDLTTGTNLFRDLALGFNRMEIAVNESAERLAQLNSSYESLLDRASTGFIALDEQGNIDFTNPTARALLDTIDDLPARVTDASKGDTDVVAVNISQDQQTLNLLATQTPRSDLNGEINGQWLIIYDVSSLRSAERKLLAAQRLSTLGELTMGMSHEISQPLQAMTLTVANLKRSLRDTMAQQPALGEKLKRIDGNIHKIANLIKFMQTYGGIGSTSDQLFDPGDCLQEEVARHDQRIASGDPSSNPHALSVKIENACPATARLSGDPEQFALVIHHIIKNAQDAALERQSETPASMTISCGASDERLEISFTDNCGGIAQDALPYVLDPFFTTKDPDKGMGLGLSVSHGIISSMGGEITASNTPNGASFVISVPLSID